MSVLRCSDCGRPVLEQGRHHVIEAAFDSLGAWPSLEYLSEYEKGNRRQRQAYADVLIRLEDFAHTGTLIIPRELNELRDGLWEIKVGKIRLPFYYTPAPARCGTVRITHGFTKNTDRTPLREIDRASGIRREDRKRP